MDPAAYKRVPAEPSYASTSRFKKRWIFYVILVLAYLPQLPGCLTAHAPKFGRVVDSVTGKGMAGVAVIATAEVSASGGAVSYPETKSRVANEYSIATITNDDGRYWIPSTWLDLDIYHFLPLFGGFEQNWQIATLKPGYVRASDEKFWDKEEVFGRPYGVKAYSPENIAPSFYLWLGFIVGMSPIEMHMRPLDTEYAARYAKLTLSTVGGAQRASKSTSSQRALYKMHYDFFLPRVCAIAPEKEIDWGLDIAYVSDWTKFENRLNEMEPDARKLALMKGGQPIYQAKTICEAMKAGG